MENKILKTSKTKWDPKKEDEDIIILKTITPHDTHSLIIFQTFFFICATKNHISSERNAKKIWFYSLKLDLITTENRIPQ